MESQRVTKIIISQSYDSFDIDVNDKHYHFDQEDTVEKLVTLFENLGYTNVTFEEVY